MKWCVECDGSGEVRRDCKHCGGYGYEPAVPEAGNDQGVSPQPKCKNCGKFKAMHQGWRWCDIPAKPNSFFQPDDEPEPQPVSEEPSMVQQGAMQHYASTMPHTNCTGPCCRPDLWQAGIKGRGELVSAEPLITYDDCSPSDAAAAEQYATAYVCKVGISKETMIDAIATLRAQVVTYEQHAERREEEIATLGARAQKAEAENARLGKELAGLRESHEEVCRLLRLIRHAPHPMPPKSELSNELIDAALANAAKLTELKEKSYGMDQRER